jgi:hypothetical protein
MKIARLHSLQKFACLLLLVFLTLLLALARSQPAASQEPQLEYLVYIPEVMNGPEPPLVTTSIAQISTSPALPRVLLITRKSDSTWLAPQYSLDGGVTWKTLPNLPWAKATVENMYAVLAPRAYGSVRILVAVNGPAEGLYRTDDFGKTWINQSLPSGGAFTSLSASPVTPKRLYTTRLDSFDGGYDPGSVTSLFTSANSGESWSNVNSALDLGFTDSLPSPVLAGRVYLHQSGYMEMWLRSDTSGATWSEEYFPNGLLVADGVDPHWLYTLNQGWSDSVNSYSNNAGFTWQPWLENPCSFGQLIAHPTRTRTLFLNCPGNIVYRSLDGAAHWTKILETRVDLIAADYSVRGRILRTKAGIIIASCDSGATWKKPAAHCP